MNNIKVIAWKIELLIGVAPFLSTQNWGRYNLIIGFETVLIFIYSLKYHFNYYKIAGKIY